MKSGKRRSVGKIEKRDKNKKSRLELYQVALDYIE